jgi:hypothetical protein
MRAHRVTSRPSSFDETSIGAGPLTRRTTRPGAAKAFGATSAERSEPTDDILGGQPGSTISVRLVAGQRYQRPTRPRQGVCSLRPIAPTEDLSLQQRGEIPAAWRRRAPLSHSDGWNPPSSRPMATRCHLLTDGRADGSDQLRCQLARPEITRIVRSVPLFDVAGCLQDDAPVRRASKLRTTSDGVRCAY